MLELDDNEKESSIDFDLKHAIKYLIIMKLKSVRTGFQNMNFLFDAIDVRYSRDEQKNGKF